MDVAKTYMQTQNLLDKLNNLKIQLIEMVSKEGLSSQKTVIISQELDQVMNQLYFRQTPYV